MPPKSAYSHVVVVLIILIAGFYCSAAPHKSYNWCERPLESTEGHTCKSRGARGCLYKDHNPLHWGACEDAYYWNWMSAQDRGELNGMSIDLVTRLARSSGFCPERRCQLDECSWISSGGCSSGCCFPQFTSGNPTRNKKSACCFKEGSFKSHAVLGYQSELHYPPTPLYRHNRTFLRKEASLHGVLSKKAFLSAHEVIPGIILTPDPKPNPKPNPNPKPTLHLTLIP